MSNAWRKPTLAASKGLGRLQRRGSRGPWPFAALLAAVVAFLALTPVLLNLLVSLIPDASRRRFGIEGAPAVRDWLSLGNVALAFAAVATVRALARARERVIVEGFVDYTKEDAKAVSGLATLLVTELGRLRELVRHVDTNVAIPAAVGVERRGGFGRAKEAAGFLTASADSLTNVLEGAVASDAKIELGPLRIPVGPALSLLNRVARGPRVLGSVHRTEAGGGPTLTAQLVGGGSSGTWRVDRERQPETAAEERAFLDTMVRELACRMFTELSLEDSGRWRAVAAFTEYLRLYRESFRTPRDRACSLKRAEAKLLEAVAEDESFGLAYYNLGVIYTKLAQAELSAERASHDLSRPGDVNPMALDATRKEAARVAFWRASEKSPDLWQAHYALAVTLFSAMPPVKVDERLRPGDARRELLEQVVRGCDQALALRPPARSSTAVVRDLRGMAAVRLGTPERDGSGRFRDGMRDHRTAVAHSWRELCRAERLARAVPGVGDARLEPARDNATAALHNLALAYARRAMLACLAGPGHHADHHGDGRVANVRRQAALAWARIDFAAADRIFRAALDVAGDRTERAIASHFERGVALEHNGDFSSRAGEPRRAARLYCRAGDAYRRAARIKPTHAEYAACRARALSKRAWALRGEFDAFGGPVDLAALAAEAHEQAGSALRELAPAFRRSVAPLTPPGVDELCDATLAALADAYRFLGDDPGMDRVAGLRDLRRRLDDAGALAAGGRLGRRPAGRDTVSSSIAALQRLRDEHRRGAGPLRSPGAPGPEWELAQIDMSLARLSAAAGRPGEAAERLGELIAELEGRGQPESERIVDFGLRAEHARALHADGRPGEALRQIAECVRADPLNSDARREAGRIHHTLGQYGEALESWKHALWLAPNDAYLHFDVALCHRRIVRTVGRRDDGRGHGGATLARAAEHLDKALQLFDGEDAIGAAWARVWGGRVALERGRLGESVALLTGALDGPAGAVAALFLGEARLETGEVGLAESAFERSRAGVARDAPEPLDRDWGGELPRDALLCRLECGLARCRLAGPDARRPAELERAGELVRSAAGHARRLEDERLRRDCEALCADVEARRLCAAGLLDAALAEAGRRLRLGPSPSARLLQAELLELAATGAAEFDDGARLRLEADAAWDELDRDGDGQVARSGHALRARLARAAPAAGTGPAGERRPPARRSGSNGGARSGRRRTRVPRP